MQIEFANAIKELIEMEYTTALLDFSELTRGGHDAQPRFLQSASEKVDSVERQADAIKRNCRRGYVPKDRCSR
jgi:hypothetical protein